MKIAVFHNFMDNIGGAELVNLTLAKELDADLYSTNVNYQAMEKMGFSGLKVKSIGPVPINAPFKQQLSSLRFRYFQPKPKYDYYIISGDWAVSAAVLNKPNLWYVHSPIREIWDLYAYTRKNSVPFFARNIFDFWVYYNRYLNKKYIKQVGKIVCNSINTKNRVERYLDRKAIVINPPVETQKFYYQKAGDYWLSVNRLISHKRVDWQIKAFSLMPEEKLIIVGSYEKSRHFRQYASYIKKIKPKNVEIKSWVNQPELIRLYAGCKGFITTAGDEDFGLTAVEAMAAGKPVIAPNEGGYQETVIDGITGRLIDEINPAKLIAVVKEIRKDPASYQAACQKQAKNFDSKIFIEKIKKEIYRPFLIS